MLNNNLINYIGRLIKEEYSKLTAVSLIEKSKQFDNEYMNCQAFVQRMFNISNIKTLPKLKFNILYDGESIENVELLQVGDILEFNNISHYSIYLGDGAVIEVEGWGEKPRVVPLTDVLEEYEGTTSIYRV